MEVMNAFLLQNRRIYREPLSNNKAVHGKEGEGKAETSQKTKSNPCLKGSETIYEHEKPLVCIHTILAVLYAALEQRLHLIEPEFYFSLTINFTQHPLGRSPLGMHKHKIDSAHPTTACWHLKRRKENMNSIKSQNTLIIELIQGATKRDRSFSSER